MQLSPRICLINSGVHGSPAGRYLTSLCMLTFVMALFLLLVTYVIHCAGAML